MNLIGQIFAFLAAILHVLIFGMESLWFMRPKVHKRFGAATAADAKTIRLFAFNQGFYNLFLAVGIFVGIALIHSADSVIIGQTLVLFSCACMLGASVVLAASTGRPMWRAAAIQGLFPLLAWVVWVGF